MASFFRSKYFWLLSLLLIAVLTYTGWRLASLNKAPTPSEVEPLPTSTETETTPEDTSSTETTGDGVDDFGSCETDVESYCSGFNSADWQDFAQENGYTSASWKLGLVDCLGAHEAQLSQTCSDSLERRQALNEDVNTICKEDRALYCAGVEPSPGSEPQVDCLKANYEQLSIECAEAVDAHEAAKPEEQ